MSWILLQYFEKVLHLQRAILAEVSAVDSIPDLGLPILGPQSPRPEGARHPGVLGAAHLAEVLHYVLVVVHLASNLHGETGTRAQLPDNFSIVRQHTFVHLKKLISFAKIEEKSFQSKYLEPRCLYILDYVTSFLICVRSKRNLLRNTNEID